jgi:hypothetical protein
MQRRVLCLLCAILVAFATRASTTVSVPNRFVAGTPAKAEDVNANFAALVNGINNMVMPLLVEDSTGKVVGPYIPFCNPVAGCTTDLFEGVFLRTSTESFVIQFSSGGPASGGVLLYTTPDCTGTAYIGTQNGTQSIMLNYAIVLNTTAYVFHWSAGASISVASEAMLNAGNGSSGSLQCSPTSGMSFAAPVVTTLDLSTLGFVPPYSIH